MNKHTEICAVEAHSGKSVKIQLYQHGMMIAIDNGYQDTPTQSFCTPELDEQILDMLLNTILDFKSQVAESRRRAAA